MKWPVSIMVFIGVALLAASLKPISDILRLVPAGHLRRTWRTLRIVIVVFMATYSIFGALKFLSNANGIAELVVAAILLAGGSFVLMVAKVSALTTRDIIRIAKLENDAILDPLTGAFNRRYLYEMIQAEVAGAKRLDRPLSVLLIDLDHFKRVNDTYGHPVGDLVLKHVACLIIDCCRPKDKVVRYGGEEFLIVALESSLEDTVLLGSFLVHEIAGSSVAVQDGADLKITASIGIASLMKGEDHQHLIARADGALYAAKEGGRNRVCSTPSVG